MNDRLKRIESKLDTLIALVQKVPEPDVEPLLTVAEAARRYKVSPTTLYRLRAVQKRIGNQVRISPVKMEKYIRSMS